MTNIPVDERDADFVREQVASGQFGSATEVISAAISRLRSDLSECGDLDQATVAAILRVDHEISQGKFISAEAMRARVEKDLLGKKNYAGVGR